MWCPKPTSDLHDVGFLVASMSLVFSLALSTVLTAVHLRRPIPLGRRYWTVMLMNAWGNVSWALNCMIATGCDGFVETKETAAAGGWSQLERVAIGYGFASSVVVGCGEVALSLVMGVSVLGVARASELSFAESAAVKQNADVVCRRLIWAIVVLALAAGLTEYFVLGFAPLYAWGYRNIIVGISVIGGPVIALTIYLWFYFRVVPFARSIETAAKALQADNSAAVAFRVIRFQQLLFFRVALYLSPSFICFGSISVIALLWGSDASVSGIPVLMASSLGIMTTIVYFSTESFISMLLEDDEGDSGRAANAPPHGRTYSWARMSTDGDLTPGVRDSSAASSPTTPQSQHLGGPSTWPVTPLAQSRSSQRLSQSQPRSRPSSKTRFSVHHQDELDGLLESIDQLADSLPVSQSIRVIPGDRLTSEEQVESPLYFDEGNSPASAFSMRASRPLFQ